MATVPAPPAFLPPTTLLRNPRSQIRVEANTYQGETRLDIREYRVFEGETTFKPTKHGITVSSHIYEDFLQALQAHGAQLPHRVVDIATGFRWIVAVRSQDVAFHKKHVYVSEALARGTSPPDGYYIFQVEIREGSVVRQRRVAVRKDGAWNISIKNSK